MLGSETGGGLRFLGLRFLGLRCRGQRHNSNESEGADKAENRAQLHGKHRAVETDTQDVG